MLRRRRSGRHMREERSGRGGFARELDGASSLSSYGRAVEIALWRGSRDQRLIWSAEGSNQLRKRGQPRWSRTHEYVSIKLSTSRVDS